MENIFSMIVLAFVQGLTEWLPVSSSGHLLLFERILGYSGGLNFEVALHFGTLMAVFIYFRKEIVNISRAFFSGKWKTPDGKMGVFIVIGTIPAALIGFFASKYFDSVLSDFVLLGMGFLVTGILLLIVGFGNSIKKKELDNKKSLVIGMAQAVAILPSISRSGATIASGILLGLDEKRAMQFSFLLSIPAILGASVLSFGSGALPVYLIIPILVSFLVGFGTIHLCFKYALNKRRNFAWFGVYCILLGIAVIVYSLV